MLVKCNRDGTVWKATPKQYPRSSLGLSEDICEEVGYAYPCQIINCPKCKRGYILRVDGIWMSDRPLEILGEEEEGSESAGTSYFEKWLAELRQE